MRDRDLVSDRRGLVCLLALGCVFCVSMISATPAARSQERPESKGAMRADAAGTQGSVDVKAGPGEFSGIVYTADDPDSLAQNAQVTLVYRDAGGAMARASTTTAPDGKFCFSGLATDPERDYVLRVDYAGKVSVGAPVRFKSGESLLQFDVLIGGDAAPLAAGASPAQGGRVPPDVPGGSMGIAGGGEEALPPGHPSIPGMLPVVGRPVVQNPAHTVLLTFAVASLFGLPILLVSRKDRERERRRAVRNG